MRALLWGLLGVMTASAVAQDAEPLLRIEREVVVRGGRSHSLAWSRDGRWIASGGECGEVLILDAQTGRVLHELQASEQSVARVAFSPDGHTLAVAGSDLSIWNVAEGVLFARFEIKEPTVAWSADGRRLAFASGRHRIAVLDAEKLTIVERQRPIGFGPAWDVAMSPDGSQVVVGREGGKTTVIGVGQRVCDHVMLEDRDARYVGWLDDGAIVRVSPNGDLVGHSEGVSRPLEGVKGLATCGPLVLLWNDTRTVVRDANGERFAADVGGPAALRADGSWVRAGAGELCFHREGTLLRRVPLPHRFAPRRGVLTADGRFGALRDATGCVRVFDAASGDTIPTPGDLRGVPLPYFGGPEVLLWTETHEGQDHTGTLSWWSVDLLRTGNSKPVRELAIPIGWKFRGCVPAMSRDGRFCGAASGVIDVVAGAESRWQTADYLYHLVPADGGECAIEVLTQLEVRCYWFIIYLSFLNSFR
jgi:WD40 repeat protein